MPDSVEIPAPVSTTIWSAPRRRAARRSSCAGSAFSPGRSRISTSRRYAGARAARPGGWARRSAGGREHGGELEPRPGGAGLRGEPLHVIERLAVALVGPLRALVAERGVEADGVERALDVVGVVALLEKGERDPTGATAGLGVRRLRELLRRPLGVRPLQLAWQPAEVTRVDGGH